MLNKLDELVEFIQKYCISFLNNYHIMGLLGYYGDYLSPVTWVENIDEIDENHLVNEEEIISFLLTLDYKKEKQLGTDYTTILFSCSIETLLIKVTYCFGDGLNTYTLKTIKVFYKKISIMFDTFYNGFYKYSPNHNFANWELTKLFYLNTNNVYNTNI